MEKGESLCSFGGNAQWCIHHGKQYVDTFKNLKFELPFDLVTSLLGIYPKTLKTLIRMNISTPVSFAMLFTVTRIGKQIKCPSVDEWIKQLWDMYTVEYYLATKKENVTLCNSLDGPREYDAK